VTARAIRFEQQIPSMAGHSAGNQHEEVLFEQCTAEGLLALTGQRAMRQGAGKLVNDYWTGRAIGRG
jgi:hypothetical protein